MTVSMRLRVMAAAVAVILVLNAMLLAAVEIAFRLWAAFPPTNAQTYQSDPKTLYAHVPNSTGWEVSPIREYPPVKLVYNEAGFRGDAIAHEKKPGEFRIFALGDSIVEGRQVDEDATLTKQLESLLRTDGIKASVINAGVSAYTTTTMNLMLRNRIADYSPDMVIAFIFANDYSDNFIYGNYSAHPELLSGLVPPEIIPKGIGLPRPASVTEWLRQNSAIYATLSNLKTTPLPSTPDPTRADSNDFLHTPRAINKAKLSEADQRLVDFTHAGLQAMADFCRDRGIAFFIAIVPWPPQVSTEEWKTGKWLSFGYRPDEGEPSTVYQKRLTDYANSHDIVAVDLLPSFRSAQATGASRSHLFLDYDGHMTAFGHAVAAQGVLSEVEALLIRGTKD